MKQNVFKLLETEAFNDFPENIQKIMVQSALLSDLPMAPLHLISDDVSFIQNAPQLTSFIWFDSLAGDYKIHPLYLEFLQSKLHILSHEEKQETYRQAAQWCFENAFYMDAMRYFAKSHQFEHMLTTLLSYPFKLPYDTCEYFYNILEEVEPNNEERTNTSVLLLKNYFIPLLLMGMGRYEEAKTRTFDIIREWGKIDTPFALNVLYSAYSNLAYIKLYDCTVTHIYDAPEYLKKSLEYYKLSTVPPADVSGPFAVADVRSFACLVGEGAELDEFDKFLEATRQSVFYIEETFHDMYYGYDDLVACEIAYYKNQLDSAKKYARQTIIKAREKKQYSVEALAEQYLLRISLHEGDYPLTKEMIKQLQSHLDNPNFWNRQLLYDVFLGGFYTLTGISDMIPSWLIMDEKELNSEVRLPFGELGICVNNCITLKKYDQALTVLCNSYPREPHERFLFGELFFALITAIAKINTGDVSGAMEELKKAYSLSFNGVFETLFIERGKHLRPLVVAALKQTDFGIPEDWLKKIDRKASVYAKKTAVISNLFKKENNIEEPIQLSERERQVLNDLYHGLTREEIAENRYLSFPHVKKIIESLYVKLDANNNVDAIRIALQKKLIE
jgi:DNA-binding CsgD family transcriptional regulator